MSCPWTWRDIPRAHAIAPSTPTIRRRIPTWCAKACCLTPRTGGRHTRRPPLPFVDVFCETGAFTLEQSRQILGRAKQLGFPLKVHADEFDNLGGTSLPLNWARLLRITREDLNRRHRGLGRLGDGCRLAPCTPFGLAEHEYTPHAPSWTPTACWPWQRIATRARPGMSRCSL